MPHVQVDQLTIHYEISGQGMPLVCLHGMSNNAQSWSNQIRNLQSHFTVIVWDAPGYGLSSDPKEVFKSFKQFADVLKVFLNALHYDSVHLLGHSMGAAIAVEFCNEYPEMVKSLILSDATRGAAALSEEENVKRLQKRLSIIETMNPSDIASNRINDLVAPDTSEEVRGVVQSIMSQIRPMGYKSVAYSLSNANQMDFYKNINKPSLIICGELDRVTPVKESIIIHELIQRSQLKIIPNAGHLCYQEYPEVFNRIVIEFLEQRSFI